MTEIKTLLGPAAAELPIAEASVGMSGWFAQNKSIVLRFANGYGASVIHGATTYGGRHGLLEVAVIVWESPAADILDFRVAHDTPVTSDVEGWLTTQAAINLLHRIAALPRKEETHGTL